MHGAIAKVRTPTLEIGKLLGFTFIYPRLLANYSLDFHRSNVERSNDEKFSPRQKQAVHGLTLII